MSKLRCHKAAFHGFCVLFFRPPKRLHFLGVKILSRVWTQLRFFGTVPGFRWLCVASLMPPWAPTKAGNENPRRHESFSERKIRHWSGSGSKHSWHADTQYLWWLPTYSLILKPEFLLAFWEDAPCVSPSPFGGIPNRQFQDRDEIGPVTCFYSKIIVLKF